MKLKPIMSPNLPVRMALAFVSPDLEEWWIREVVDGCLHTPAKDTTPDQHYIQWPDFMNQRRNGMCGVKITFSELSASCKRSGTDFYNARVMVRDEYARIMKATLPKGRECGLFVTSQTNRAVEYPDNVFETLNELPRIVVAGEAKPDKKLDTPVGYFSFKPLRDAGLWTPSEEFHIWFDTTGVDAKKKAKKPRSAHDSFRLNM